MMAPKPSAVKVAVIGAGAAGYFAAITCAETNRNLNVVLIEASRQPLYKVGISGGGRCNVTNNCFELEQLLKGYPRGHKELIGPFKRFQPRDTVEWFESRGVKLKAEEDGRMFPVTDNSETIIDCLKSAASKAEVETRLHARVDSVQPTAGFQTQSGFEIHFKNLETEYYDAVVLATGSSPSGYKIAQSMGHVIIPPVPSLFTFKIKDDRIGDLAGLSFEQVQLELRFPSSTSMKWSGPLLITHWGLSGPAVLKLSAWGARELFQCRYESDLTINFVVGMNAESLIEAMHRYRVEHPTRAIMAHNLLPIPKRYWERIAAVSGVQQTQTWSHITKEQLLNIANELTRGQFRVIGKGEFKEEFVTAGGVKLKEVNFETMESRKISRLYFAGEVLDIDGITGGYNFQAAWSTGWIAGKSIAESFLRSS